VSSITDDERIRRAQLLFETHQERQLQALFPRESLVNATNDSSALCWSETTTVTKKLRDLLPFGRVLAPTGFEEFTNHILPRIVDAAQEQLLYWHLSSEKTANNYPAETLLLWNHDDYFWFTTIPAQENILVNQILREERIRFLERFRLDYDEIQLSFHELRLASQSSSQHRLVITEGKEITYKWRNQEWETAIENSDYRLINPSIYHFPPEHPYSPRNQEFANNPRIHVEPEELTEALVELFRQEDIAPRNPSNSLPPSSPPNPSTPDSNSGWGTNFAQSWNREQNCWCEGRELCTCGFRPDTPPTPPSVVLWQPGRHYLPSFE
jgi:hypothetical protein